MSRRVERAIGGPPLALTLAGLALPAQLADDLTGGVRGTHGPVTIRRWRTSADERPAAATCSVTVSADALAAAGYAGPPQLGDQLLVDLSPAAAAAFGLPAGHQARRRFVGRLTDAKAMPETAAGGPARYQLVAAGPAARLGRVDIGQAPWPVELDGERVERILADAATQAGGEIVAGPVDAGTLSVLARDVDAQPALGLVDDLATSCGGELVELRDGSLAYHDAEHRRNAPAVVELLAGEVLAPAAWSSSLAGLVNDLTLRYGPGTGPSQASVQLVDEVAAGGPIGRLTASLSTQLVDLAAAQLRATDLVGRRSRQRWAIEQLPVDLVATVDLVKAGELLGTTFGDRVDLAGFPATGPFAVAAVWVEGQTETIGRDSWRLDLAVSEFGLTAPAPRFVDYADARTIAGVPDDVSFLGATSYWPNGGRESAGRFVDVPAGLDYDDVPDAELIGATTY